MPILPGLGNSIKRKIFVSYHHDLDQFYYNDFSNTFATNYESISDNSLEREVDSDDPEYVMRRIRETYISGTYCTVVLCGSETFLRKYVDWEIKATLDKEHSLIGIILPGCIENCFPNRLVDNINSGYALLINWKDVIQNRNHLSQCIEIANQRSRMNINNGRQMQKINGSLFP